MLLSRTRLAYVHLRNLLTDAKRDRGARVSGYVAIWLPEELIVLYLHNGEVVTATLCDDTGSRAVSIARALDLVPAEPEYGDICFCAAEPEQLDCMYLTHTMAPVNWPERLAVSDPVVLFPYLGATTFDGLIEITAGDAVNYVIFVNGMVCRSYLAGAPAPAADQSTDGVGQLFAQAKPGELRVRRWNGVPELAVQAPTALVQAYRDLASSLVGSLVEGGRTSAPAIAEHARLALLEQHPVLDGIALSDRPAHADLVADTATLTTGVAAWVREVMWTAVDHDAIEPVELIKAITWERRHMFQSAGFYEQIPWKVL
jgi:hypothetical protein